MKENRTARERPDTTNRILTLPRPMFENPPPPCSAVKSRPTP